MNREQKTGKEYAKHISMELTADSARVTNLSLEGSRLVLTIEAELADSHLRSSDAAAPEPAPVGQRRRHPEVAFDRIRDDTEVVRHPHSAEASALGFADPGEVSPGILAMGSENLPPAPAAYMPEMKVDSPLGTLSTDPARSLSIGPEQLIASEPVVGPALFSQPESFSQQRTTPPPLPSPHCADGNDTQELDIDKSMLDDGTDTISLDRSEMPVPDFTDEKTATDVWENTPVSTETAVDAPGTEDREKKNADNTDTTVPLFAVMADKPSPSAPDAPRGPAILGESAAPLTGSEIQSPPVEPWKAPELDCDDIAKAFARSSAEQEEAAKAGTLQRKAVEEFGDQPAVSEESSTIGGVRHGEPQPAISFGQDAPEQPAPPAPMTPGIAKPVDEQPQKPPAAGAPSPAEAKNEPPKPEETAPSGASKPEGGGTTVLIRYTCPKCKTQGMQAVDKVGTVVNCSNCGKAMRLVMKK